jgi:hypothetical protein
MAQNPATNQAQETTKEVRAATTADLEAIYEELENAVEATAQNLTKQINAQFVEMQAAMNQFFQSHAAGAGPTVAGVIPPAKVGAFVNQQQELFAQLKGLKDPKKVQRAMYVGCDKVAGMMDLNGPVRPMAHLSRGELLGVVATTAVVAGGLTAAGLVVQGRRELRKAGKTKEDVKVFLQEGREAHDRQAAHARTVRVVK